MKRSLIILFFATTVFAQTASQPVPVISSVPLSSFQLGAGSKLEAGPDGAQALFVGYGSTASVDLGTSPAAIQAYPPGQPPYVREGVYTLTFDVINNLAKYPGYYQLEVDFGTQELCSVDGWGKVTYSAVTVVCPGPGYIVVDKALPGGGLVQGTHNFVLHATSPGWPVDLKNVSLTFTPTN